MRILQVKETPEEWLNQTILDSKDHELFLKYCDEHNISFALDRMRSFLISDFFESIKKINDSKECCYKITKLEDQLYERWDYQYYFNRFRFFYHEEMTIKERSHLSLSYLLNSKSVKRLTLPPKVEPDSILVLGSN